MSLRWDLSDLFSCQWLWENVTPVTAPDSSVSSLDWGGGSGEKNHRSEVPLHLVLSGAQAVNTTHHP